MKKFTLLSIAILCIISLQAQSPWAQGKGGGYAQVAFQIIPEYSDFFTGSDSTYTSLTAFTDAGIQLYGEYGVLANTTIVVNVPFKMLTSALEMRDNVTLNGLGNLTLGAKQQILNDPVAVGVGVDVELPTSSYDETYGLRTGYDALSIIPKASVGIGKEKFYAFARAGVAIRNNDYSNHLLAGAEAGYHFFNKLWFMLDADVYSSFENGDREDLFANELSKFYVNDQEWIAFSAKLMYNATENLGVLGTSTVGIISAKNVPMSPHFSFGVFYNW